MNDMQINVYTVYKDILNRFILVIIELEQIMQNLKIHRIPITDPQQNINQPLIKEVYK